MTPGVRTPRYTVVIQWSAGDRCYVASLPEWGPYCNAYGDMYEEAAKNAREVLELLIETEAKDATPAPQLFHYPGAAVVDLPGDAVGVRRGQRGDAPRRRTA
jgi:antitoxin HicB